MSEEPDFLFITKESEDSHVMNEKSNNVVINKEPEDSMSESQGLSDSFFDFDFEVDVSVQFTKAMLADMKFMTENCKFEATVQRKFLENKYLIQTICLKDLYYTMQRLHPNNKALLNDAAKV
ncbi:10806_t:CDS:2 [Racocetra fulgida]|uniref:10806_t:CDS:1 n=1 Tax=Racocetra fulgida TaxID=60492 RepID=A0A9N8YX44_9GLOM|nr:10806_t:CDS:2 [Racocetra fulgida]